MARPTCFPALSAPNMAGIDLRPLAALFTLGVVPPMASPFASHTTEQMVFGVNPGGALPNSIAPTMTQGEMISAIQALQVATGTPLTPRLAYIDEMYIGGTPDWSEAKQIEAIEAGPLAIPEYTWGAYHLPHTFSPSTSTNPALVAQNDAVLGAIAACGVWMPDFYVSRSVAKPARLRASVAYNMSEVRRALGEAGVKVDEARVIPFLWWGLTPPSDPVAPMPRSVLLVLLDALEQEGITEFVLWGFIHPSTLTGTIDEYNRATRRWLVTPRMRRRRPLLAGMTRGGR